MFDYLVIGKGLIGAAAARYLSEQAASVVLVGPDEPTDWATYQGVFASHYDQGRITRILDSNLVWGTLAKRSIAHYRSLETRSGICFYEPVGMAQAGPAGTVAATAAVGNTLQADFASYSSEQLRTIHPALRFPAGFDCLLESGAAGYVNPRALVAAQVAVAQQQGVTVIRETVTAVSPHATHLDIHTDHGQRVQARKVLVAAGAYSNSLLPQPLGLIRKPRTILLAEVSGAELERLRNLPAVIYDHGRPDAAIDGIYMLPPIRYENGRFYLKIGGDLPDLVPADSDETVRDWFNQGGSQREANALRQVIEDILPGLKADSYHHKPCVVTYRLPKYPIIDTLLPNQLVVATAGCGAAAKSSDEIGRLAAHLLQAGAWQDSLEERPFQMG
jgi:sarcosine oxidase